MDYKNLYKDILLNNYIGSYNLNNNNNNNKEIKKNIKKEIINHFNKINENLQKILDRYKYIDNIEFIDKYFLNLDNNDRLDIYSEINILEIFDIFLCNIDKFNEIIDLINKKLFFINKILNYNNKKIFYFEFIIKRVLEGFIKKNIISLKNIIFILLYHYKKKSLKNIIETFIDIKFYNRNSNNKILAEFDTFIKKYCLKNESSIYYDLIKKYFVLFKKYDDDKIYKCIKSIDIVLEIDRSIEKDVLKYHLNIDISLISNLFVYFNKYLSENRNNKELIQKKKFELYIKKILNYFSYEFNEFIYIYIINNKKIFNNIEYEKKLLSNFLCRINEKNLIGTFENFIESRVLYLNLIKCNNIISIKESVQVYIIYKIKEILQIINDNVDINIIEYCSSFYHPFIKLYTLYIEINMFNTFFKNYFNLKNDVKIIKIITDQNVSFLNEWINNFLQNQLNIDYYLNYLINKYDDYFIEKCNFYNKDLHIKKSISKYRDLKSVEKDIFLKCEEESEICQNKYLSYIKQYYPDLLVDITSDVNLDQLKKIIKEAKKALNIIMIDDEENNNIIKKIKKIIKSNENFNNIQINILTENNENKNIEHLKKDALALKEIALYNLKKSYKNIKIFNYSEKFNKNNLFFKNIKKFVILDIFNFIGYITKISSDKDFYFKKFQLDLTKRIFSKNFIYKNEIILLSFFSEMFKYKLQKIIQEFVIEKQKNKKYFTELQEDEIISADKKYEEKLEYIKHREKLIKALDIASFSNNSSIELNNSKYDNIRILKDYKSIKNDLLLLKYCIWPKIQSMEFNIDELNSIKNKAIENLKNDQIKLFFNDLLGSVKIEFNNKIINLTIYQFYILKNILNNKKNALIDNVYCIEQYNILLDKKFIFVENGELKINYNCQNTNFIPLKFSCIDLYKSSSIPFIKENSNDNKIAEAKIMRFMKQKKEYNISKLKVYFTDIINFDEIINSLKKKEYINIKNEIVIYIN